MATKIQNIDVIAVNEVILICSNDSKLYDVLIKTYLPNLQKKLIAGKYDPQKAIKLLEIFYTRYCRPRLKGITYKWDPKLNPGERYEVAKYFSEYLYLEFLKPLEKNKPKAAKKVTLSARGWHKEHNNYNKAEKWERKPANRKTPARNVIKAKKSK